MVRNLLIKHRSLNTLLLLLLAGSPLFLFAREAPRVINFSKAQYQAQNQNWMISQDNDWRMYFANSAGVMQFDGAKWDVQPIPDRRTPRAIACAPDGRVYWGAFGTFGYSEPNASGGQEQQLWRLLRDTADLQKAQREEIWNIFLHNDFVLFQSFAIIYKYYPETKVLEDITPPGNIMFVHDLGEKLLVQVIGKGIYELTPRNEFIFQEGTQSLGTAIVKSILPVADGSYLVATEHDGVFRYANGELSTWKAVFDGIARTNQINKGIRLSNGNYAFGTILNGVFILDPKGEVLFHLNRSSGLQNNTVLALYEDHASNLWLGLDKGIDLIELNSPVVYYTDKEGKPGAVYTAAVFEGNLYIGANQGVFYKPWPSNGEDFRLLEGTQGQVWELRVLDGQLLCGHNEGTFAIQGKQASKISSITGGWTMQLHPTRSDILLQGTYTGVIVLRKNPDGRWQFSHRIEGFIEPVKRLLFDVEGNVWVANPYKGLYRLKLSEDLYNWTEIRPYGAKDGLPSEFKADIFRFNGAFVTRSAGKLFHYDKDGRWKPFELLQGASRAFTFAPGEWFEVYPDVVKWVRFKGTYNIPLSLIPDFESILSLGDGSYIFCLEDGYALIDGNQVRNNFVQSTPPPMLLEVEIGGSQSPFLITHHETEFLTLPAGQNNFIFRFALPIYTKVPDFQYQLEGFSPDWSPWGKVFLKEFTNLPPGNYTFRARSNASEEVVTFAFVIRPRWYQTTWAAALMLVFLCILLAIGLGWHRRRLEKQRRKLLLEKERELEQQRIRAANEKLQSDVIGKSQELANSTMNLVRKNETLMEIKEELTQAKSNAGGAFPPANYRKLQRLIEDNLSSEQDWKLFETNFNQVHEAFFNRLKAQFPDLTPGDLKLAAYLKMNLSSKEIAPLLNISVRGVENKRYRLRQKVHLDNDANLTEFMIHF
jgi:DNA-binding CsgD family transcriptional regulator